MLHLVVRPLVIAFLILIGGVAPASEMETTTAVVDGRIAYSFQSGSPEIFAMDPDGSDRINLTNHPAYDFQPAWSRDGKRIAFVSDRMGTHDIHVMNPDGSNQVALTTSSENDAEPAWSPDGTKIAFVRRLGGSNDEIFVMNADGSSPVNITNHAAFDSEPSWSPDGSRIAFISSRDGDTDVFVMNADGTSKDNLTNDAALDRYTSWSPDGSKIAFVSDRQGGYQIHLIDPDGSDLVNLTNNASADEGNPWWSPDGTRIVFHTVTGSPSSFEIFTMNRDGSDRRNLTQSPQHETDPTWQPVPVPEPQVSKARAKEGNAATFKITIPPASQPITYDFETETRKAKSKDFKGRRGTITFAPGETRKKVKVKTKEDGSDEANETFFLEVTFPGGISDRGKAKIKDDD